MWIKFHKMMFLPRCPIIAQSLTSFCELHNANLIVFTLFSSVCMAVNVPSVKIIFIWMASCSISLENINSYLTSYTMNRSTCTDVITVNYSEFLWFDMFILGSDRTMLLLDVLKAKGWLPCTWIHLYKYMCK